jgi:hypothetical protein
MQTFAAINLYFIDQIILRIYAIQLYLLCLLESTYKVSGDIRQP